jgi:hypothetical protein
MSSINAYLGAGTTFWNGDVLPEDNHAPFIFKALSGYPIEESECELFSNYLEIRKTIVGNQKGIYEGGGLYSPAANGYPLMASVSMKMAAADVTPDLFGFSGVLFGLKADNKGIAIKFYSSGIVEMQDAAFLTSSPPGPAYSVSYDWDQNKVHTYYILWHPALNTLRLYVSSDPSSDIPDTLLIDGLWSDFSDIPVEERPIIQPVLYFGNGYPTQLSVSRWYTASLYHQVTNPILNGVFPGGHTGFIQSDEVVEHNSTALFQETAHAWIPIPATSVDGNEILHTTEKTVELVSVPGSSFGFYRREPKIAGAPFLLDFELGGFLRNKYPGDSSGMELFVDDGVRQARFAFLESYGVQYIGLLSGTNPNVIDYYTTFQTGWGILRDYRLLLDPSSNVRVITLEEGIDGVYERTLITVPYSGLPPTSFPATSIGFLHNADTNSAAASLLVGRVRYSTQAANWESTALPSSPWSQQGSGGTATLPSGETGMDIDDTSLVDHLYFRKSLAGLNPSQGFFTEFLCRVLSYGISDVEDPLRENVGIGARVQDGLLQYTVLFADAGPEIGRIVYLATMADYEANLLAIREGSASTAGTYAAVDWTKSHLYRLERKIGGGLRLLVDNAKEPIIEVLDEDNFDAPLAIGAFQGIEFGSFLDDHKSLSRWHLLRNSVSYGYDGEVFPILTEQEISERFDNSLICLVEAESP